MAQKFRKLPTNQSQTAPKKKRTFDRSTKISLIALASILMVCLLVGIFFFHHYGKVISASVDAGQKHAQAIQEGDFKQFRATTLLGKDGQPLRELKKQEHEYMSYKEMDPLISDALIAIEDRRFYEHHGVDTQGLLTVALNALLGRGVRGASTITQQLVKNIYLTPEVSVSRKVEEMVMAQSLEKKFSKHQILEYYLNNVYFGHGAYGVNAAAQVYFGKSVNDISLLEKAALIGITNNPEIFDPISQKKNSLNRAKLILKEMRNQGYITTKDYNKAVKSDFHASLHKEALSNDLGDNEIALAIDSATKILMQEQNFHFQYQFDSKEAEDRYNKEYKIAYDKVYQRILSGGYTIKTTIDPNIHQQLQGVVSQVMDRWQERQPDGKLFAKQAAMTVIDNSTGSVVASIGGRGEEGNTYNRAFLSYRQPGSSIKPLVAYAPAYARGLLETSTISDDRPNDTYPNNIYNGSKGMLTLRNAMAISSNVAAYKLAMENRQETREPVYHPLAQMQFTGLDVADNNPIIAVGGMTYGVSTQEMAGGIATLVNQGNYRTPTNVESITRKDTNKEIFSIKDTPQRKVYSDDAAYLTIDTMKAVHEAGGTTSDLSLAHNTQWAVKTGTTDDAKDLWIVGATPYYTVAVWIGDDTPQPQDNSVLLGTRAIFKETMDLLNNGKENIDFQMPSSVQRVGGQLITRASQTKQVLSIRKDKLQSAEKEINTLLKQRANDLLAEKLNAPMTVEASNFSNRLLADRITILSQFTLIVTDTKNNWENFDQYAQKVLALIKQVEPSGGYLTDMYNDVYKSKQTEYERLKTALNSSTKEIDNQIKDTKNNIDSLDKQIDNIRNRLSNARPSF